MKYADTILRGTLRYKGFSESLKALLGVGLLDTEPHLAFDPTTGPDMTWVRGNLN